MNKIISCSGGDDKAFLTSIKKDGQEKNVFDLSEDSKNPHKDSVSCVAFNTSYVGEKDKKLFALGCFDGTIQIWDLDAGSLLHKLEGPTDVEWVSWHPKGGSVSIYFYYIYFFTF